MLSHLMPSLRQGHLGRLRHARRRGHGLGPAGAAVHLPLTVGVRTGPRRPATDRHGGWRRQWTTRRVAAATVLTLPLWTVMADAGGGWAPGSLPGWSAVVALTALLGASTLATYVPLPGRAWRLDLRCAPCAAMAGLSVLAATWLLALGPHQASMAAVAAVTTASGLAQRLTSDGDACSTG